MKGHDAYALSLAKETFKVNDLEGEEFQCLMFLFLSTKNRLTLFMLR